MKHFKTLFKITSILSLATLIVGIKAHQKTAYAEMSPKSDTTSFSQVKSIEYYLRWDHDKFKSHYAWRLIPPANAELPPQYQKAFALKVWPNHRKKSLVIHYNEQMVTDDKSHRSGKLNLTSSDYEVLSKILAQPITCSNKTERGWVGPSPEYLNVQYTASELLIFASSNPNGPTGPTAAISEQGKRMYLCNTQLQDWLKAQRKAALKDALEEPNA